VAEINMEMNWKWKNIYINGSNGIIENGLTKHRALFHTILNIEEFS